MSYEPTDIECAVNEWLKVRTTWTIYYSHQHVSERPPTFLTINLVSESPIDEPQTVLTDEPWEDTEDFTQVTTQTMRARVIVQSYGRGAFDQLRAIAGTYGSDVFDSTLVPEAPHRVERIPQQLSTKFRDRARTTVLFVYRVEHRRQAPALACVETRGDVDGARLEATIQDPTTSQAPE